MTTSAALAPPPAGLTTIAVETLLGLVAQRLGAWLTRYPAAAWGAVALFALFILFGTG